MTTDEVKAWLRSYRLLKAEIDTLENEIAEWKSRAARLTQSYSGMPSGSGSTDQIPSTVERIMELEERLQHKADKLTQTRHDIENAVEMVPNSSHRTLLRKRYIDGERDWDAIGDTIGYTERHARRVHGWALQSLKNVLKCPPKSVL